MARKSLRIARGLTLPLESVVESYGFYGMRGSGKTYGASVLGEEVHAVGAQFVFIDPTDAAWGFKSSADGEGPGLPVYVFGGSHADVPLEPTAGAVIADVVVEQGISAVLSLRHMRKAEQHRFMTAFCEQLYHRKGEPEHRTPLHLFIDEAHAFAPQQVRGDVARMVGAVEDLGRMGRNTGVGLSLISQRPASVNANVRTQAETLVAFRIMHKLDRTAIDGWIEAHDTEGRRDEFFASLASLADGEAWVWSPKLDIFERVRIRARRTFDSSATPKPGEVRIEPKEMAALDIEKLGQQIAETVERADANDPAKLKAEITKLEREKSQQTPVVDTTEVDTLRAELDQADQQRAEAVTAAVGEVRTTVIAVLQQFSDRAIEAIAELNGAEIKAPVAPARTRRSAPAPAPPIPRLSTPRHVSTSGEKLKKAERAILTALAQYPSGLSKARVAMMSGYVIAGGFNNALGSCRTAGWIEGERASDLVITALGLGVLGNSWEPLPAGADLITYWENHQRMHRPSRLVLRTLYERHPEPQAVPMLAELHGYQVAGGWNNGMSRLVSLGLAVRDRGFMRLSDELAEAVFE